MLPLLIFSTSTRYRYDRYSSSSSHRVARWRRVVSRAMGMQTEGLTQLAAASGCAEASKRALACASPSRTRARIPDDCRVLSRRAEIYSAPLTRRATPDPSTPSAGAAAHGENKAKMCDELFKAYKDCRKAEHAETVRRRRENRKGLF
jgi:hypothetical protein